MYHLLNIPELYNMYFLQFLYEHSTKARYGSSYILQFAGFCIMPANVWIMFSCEGTPPKFIGARLCLDRYANHRTNISSGSDIYAIFKMTAT